MKRVGPPWRTTWEMEDQRKHLDFISRKNDWTLRFWLTWSLKQSRVSRSCLLSNPAGRTRLTQRFKVKEGKSSDLAGRRAAAGTGSTVCREASSQTAVLADPADRGGLQASERAAERRRDSERERAAPLQLIGASGWTSPVCRVLFSEPAASPQESRNTE